VGKIGNIGYRLYHTLKLLDKKNIQYTVICSQYQAKNLRGKIIQMGYFSLIGHFLNYLRRSIFKNLDSGSINAKLFEFFVIISLKFIKLQNIKKVYLWEMSPTISDILKNKYIITEFCMSPVQFAHSQMQTKINIANANREKQTVQRSSLLISPSKLITTQLKKLYKKKIYFLPFASNYFYKKKTMYLSRKKSINFCFAGLINQRKGINYLLEAWNNECFDSHKLYLYGKLFRDQNKLIKKINKNNIFVNNVSNMKNIYKKHDVFIFPTLLEGSAKVIYEAAASNMCIITTKEAGSFITNKKDGIIIKSKNIEEIVGAMRKVNNDRKMLIMYANNAYKKSLKYTWSRYAKGSIKFLLK
jgi:glycosyltransferase involved in cell wall biosynthesis